MGETKARLVAGRSASVNNRVEITMSDATRNFLSLRHAPCEVIVVEIQKISLSMEASFDKICDAIFLPDDWVRPNEKYWTKQQLIQMVLLSMLEYDIDPFTINLEETIDTKTK
jgi:hypothetical protein